ncbi:MAG TPA: TonB-dependent receptor [Vicinamibacterales bacterium]|nr:TonB-dependent receptor [Vicinamibacterales bacterium]
MRTAIATLLLAGSLAAPLAAQEGSEAPFYAGRPLVEVLQDLNQRGLRIVFSSSLVPVKLRVTSEPAGTPRDILDQVLRPHGLVARAGAQGVLIVARAPRRREDAASPVPNVALPPIGGELPAPTASVSGQVRDESGAPIPGAVITVTATSRGAISRVTSGTDGRFEVGGLARGLYAVMGEQPGLLPAVIPEVLLAAGGSRSVILELKVPGVTEATTVATSNPIIDVQNATVGTNFGSAMLRDIPNQRDVFALLAQTPGIVMPRPDVGGNTAGTQSIYRAYGLYGQSITTVDGVNITSGSDMIGAYIDYGALAEATVAAAGNPAEVPVAGAAVTTVIKSGNNSHHAELYADYKPGGSKRYDGAEHYAQYRDLNAQLGGPFLKDRLWYFTSFRDQHTALTTGMFDRPPQEGGTQGHPFTTQTTEYTIKLNQRLTGDRTLTFMTQLGAKYQPYRFGSGVFAPQYLVESTARQDSRSHIGKAGFLQVIGNRATLDTSFNVYGNHFPLTARTDKTPIIDDVTFSRRGAYANPAVSQDQRRHYNADFVLYADRHDIKIGYMYQRYAPRFTAYGAPGPAGTTGHFYIATTNGVPTSFWTDNGPLWSLNVLKNHALFFQDKFQLASKLTLNVGVRFDRYDSSYPEQRFGLNGNQPCVDQATCEVGPFAVRAVTPARQVATFNTVVPRIALIYDLFGNSKTALKASWGRFATNPAASIAALVNPIDVTTRKYAWDADYLTTDTAIAATRITPAYVSTLRPIFGGAQLTPTTVDPDLKDSYTDEFTVGVEQEIAGDVRAHATAIRKQQRNTFGRYDRLRTLSAFTPVQVLDPGPDSIVRNADDRIITVWETSVPPDTTDYFLTNKPIGDTYNTVELGVTKRMSDHWQLTSGVDWTQRQLSSEFSENPNVMFWNSNNTQTTGWTFKASGSYLFNRGVLVSLSYNAMKGEPYGRLFTVTEPFLRLADPNRTTPLRQGNMTIVAEKIGTYYLPAINMINLRAQKEFAIRDRQRLSVMVNIFNLTGAETVTDVAVTTNRAFRQPSMNITGTVLRFGARYTF